MDFVNASITLQHLQGPHSRKHISTQPVSANLALSDGIDMHLGSIRYLEAIVCSTLGGNALQRTLIVSHPPRPKCLPGSLIEVMDATFDPPSPPSTLVTPKPSVLRRFARAKRTPRMRNFRRHAWRIASMNLWGLPVMSLGRRRLDGCVTCTARPSRTRRFPAAVQA